MIDGKYVVYPKAGPTEPLPDRTYFVLRSTDLFGHAVLWMYLNLIQTQLELARLRSSFTEDELLALEDLETYVHDLAVEWQRAGKGRLPT